MPFESNYQAPQAPGGYVSMQDAQAREQDMQAKKQTLRMAVEQGAQQRQLGAQAIQENDLALQQKRMDAQDQSVMRDAYMQSGGDMQKFQQLVMQRGASPKAIQQIQSQLLAQQEAHAKLDKQQLENEAAKTQAIGSEAQSLLALPDDATRTINWPAVRQRMLTAGHAKPEEIPEQYPGEQWVTLHRNAAVTVQQSIENAVKDRTATAAETNAAARKATAGTGAAKLADERDTRFLNSAAAAGSQQELDQLRGQAKAQGISDTAIARIPSMYSPQAMTQFGRGLMTQEQRVQADQAKTNADDTKRYRDAELDNAAKQLNLSQARLFQDREQTTLTPQALDKMAEMFATTGQLPGLGMGAAASKVRSSIINRAADKYPDVQFATSKATYQANQSSLKTVTGTLDSVTAFEKSAVANLKRFTDAADKIPDWGAPWINTPVRLLNDKLIGSENMAVANAARQIALREIARVTSDPRMMGQLSDSARHEVMELSPQDATLKQIKAVSKLVLQDVATIHQNLSEQRDAIMNRLGANEGGTAPAAVTHTFNPATGRIEEKK